MNTPNMRSVVLPAVAALLLAAGSRAAETTAEVKSLAVNGGWEDGKGRLTIEANLKGLTEDKDRPIFATALQQNLRLSFDKLTCTFRVTFDILQGAPRELTLTLAGEGEIVKVTGEGLQDWSLRQETNGTRTLVLRPLKTDKPLSQLAVTIAAEREFKTWPNPLTAPTLTPPQPALFNGYVKVESIAEWNAQPEDVSGLAPIECKYLPEAMGREAKPDEAEPLAFRFHGAAYRLALRLSLADPESRRVVLRDFKLTGQLGDTAAAFELAATAHVRNPRGGSLSLLSGDVALTSLDSRPEWRWKLVQGQYVLSFDKAGEYPLRLKFNAAVRPSNGWNTIAFRLAPAAVQPVVFQGLAADTQFEFAGGARPERAGADFATYLPANGAVALAWKGARRESEGRLFYTAESLAQVSLSPGLMRQIMLLDFRVMQGEMNQVALRLRGPGEVTRVLGEQVLSWALEPVAGSADRRLLLRLNQAQKEAFSVQIQMQRALGAFPQAVDAIGLQPEAATRFAGFFRVVNEGAVRLEVLQSGGLSQISPEQFPESETTKAVFRAGGGQRFAFRHSSAEYGLRIQADNVLPEVSVSQVLAYHLGEAELSLEAEIELEIREAPVREMTLNVPRGFALARLTAQGVADYFLREPPERTDAELRLVYSQPVSGRQIVALRLERNKPLAEASWPLPRIEVARAKSTRGHVGASSDPGFRLTPERTQGLTEIATAFFPKKGPGIQAAFRIADPAWQATLRVERLPQTVQADAFHLFSIGEGVAYGSSVINYFISGAPVSSFRVELPGEFLNVEFIGREIRNWVTNAGGYVVHLHTPVSGSYALLATYERPFRAQGETLAFVGARPLDAQTEQGHTLVISAYQFDVKPAEVSAGLLQLETGEVPPEYRLFFDAPILAAYRYTARPFNLRLALSRLAQGETLSLVVDRASLSTRISKEGQVLTDARYYVKNRGQPHFRLRLPDGAQLWSATINGASVAPVTDDKATLIPLPTRGDPNAVLTIDLKLAARSADPQRLELAAPILAAPLMLGEWKLEPDSKQRLVYRGGSLTPAGGVADVSGFASMGRMFTGREGSRAVTAALLACVCLLAMVGLWRWAAAEGVYRWGARHLTGLGLGLAAFLVATVCLVLLGDAAERHQGFLGKGLAFLAPVQQSNSAITLRVDNVPAEATLLGRVWTVWPAFLALALWVYGRMAGRDGLRSAGLALCWTLLAWAVLRFPNSVPGFLVLIWLFLLLEVVWPAARRLWRQPRRPASSPPPAGAAAAAASILFLLTASVHGAEAAASPSKEPPLAESVSQQIRVEDKFVFATAKVRWQAARGRVLPLLFEPAVLTRVVYPTNSLKLVRIQAGGQNAQGLLALADGSFEIEAAYQVQAGRRDGESGFALPTQHGLVNQVVLTVADRDVEVFSAQAVSVRRDPAVTNATAASLVLLPANDAWIGWKPRSRDVRREKAVFYTEMVQLYAPAAGVIEGAHLVQVRPAQGEIGELVFDVPGGAAISDVIEPARAAAPADAKNSKTPGASLSLVSMWRFDPDARRLRISLSPAQSRPFTLLIRSQVAAGPLPFEQSVGLLSLNQAADQLGLLGFATGSEVQLDSVTAAAFTPINLEDFPSGALAALQGQFAGLTVRRAFRFTGAQGTATLKASPVEPDVRVQSQQTLSLGEDRTVLAATLEVDVIRAGIFRLSFALPPGLDVEAISGPALSHWTELKADTNRIITLHLKGRVEGKQQLSVSLAGPGVRAVRNWAVPRLALREAGKQEGQLLIVPEQGMRLQTTDREGVTQLDPQRAGVRQKGVLAFRLLPGTWRLGLDIEQVDAWVQVTSHQHATVNEAQVKVAANLQYQIENAGLKSLRVLAQTNAESVRFTGEQVADFLPVPGAVANGLQEWEVKLHRRVIGRYLLQMTCQYRLPENAGQTVLRGIQAAGANLQRGFVTVQSGGRLQVRAPSAPPALQPSEWQTVPRALRQNLEAASANYTFRLIEPAFELPIQIERHEAAKLLPARVNAVVLTSVISDEGVMLTQVRLEMLPGDKRLLSLTLPTNAAFWFAFANQNGVWPWRENDRYLIPLEAQARSGQALSLEFFYSSQIGRPARGSLDLNLLGPRFDLPLENIQWRVYLSEKWDLKDASGSLQLQEQRVASAPVSMDVSTYLQSEVSLQKEKTREAEQMLSAGNTALERGDPGQARRAFQAAYGLSAHDDAFNEDARVQLHNLKLQQALVGLNVRQAGGAGESVTAVKLRELASRKGLNYTQQEAKQILDASSAEENTVLMRLAERLIQQQDAAVSSPSAIRANVPQQGRLITFSRAVLVDTWADLKLRIQATAARPASTGLRFLVLAGLFAGLAALVWIAAAFRTSPPKPTWNA